MQNTTEKRIIFEDGQFIREHTQKTYAKIDTIENVLNEYYGSMNDLFWTPFTIPMLINGNLEYISSVYYKKTKTTVFFVELPGMPLPGAFLEINPVSTDTYAVFNPLQDKEKEKVIEPPVPLMKTIPEHKLLVTITIVNGILNNECCKWFWSTKDNVHVPIAPNTYSNGTVCLGHNEIPEVCAKYKNIVERVRAVLHSLFTCPMNQDLYSNSYKSMYTFDENCNNVQNQLPYKSNEPASYFAVIDYIKNKNAPSI